MEVFIALLRNVACVFKSTLSPGHAMLRPFHLYPVATRLDICIVVLQLVGAAYHLYKGLDNCVGGWTDRATAAEWRAAAAAAAAASSSSEKPKAGADTKTADSATVEANMQALRETLERRQAAGVRRVAIGVCQLMISLGFVFLALSGVHHISLPPVIWSLAGTEVSFIV
jgi:hypothetical protein